MSRAGGIKSVVALAAAICLVGIDCSRMKTQPRYDPLEASEFFADGASARPLVAGTVPYASSPVDHSVERFRAHGQLVTELPFKLTRADLERGQEQFDIFCSVCHGRTGYGDGMIVRRGFTPPPSYHLPRLCAAPIGHFYEVMTDGWGAMYSFNDKVVPMDRWRIAAYIRTLQLSQGAVAADLPEADRRKLTEVTP